MLDISIVDSFFLLRPAIAQRPFVDLHIAYSTTVSNPLGIFLCSLFLFPLPVVLLHAATVEGQTCAKAQAAADPEKFLQSAPCPALVNRFRYKFLDQDRDPD